MSRFSFSPARSQGYGSMLDDNGATRQHNSNSNSNSNNYYSDPYAGREPSPRMPDGAYGGGSSSSTAMNNGGRGMYSTAIGAAASVSLHPTALVPSVELSYYARYKSFGTQEYQGAFAITALAEVVLDRVLSELPENPWLLMAKVCKEWSDAAFEEAERLYGEDAMAKGRSPSPAAGAGGGLGGYTFQQQQQQRGVSPGGGGGVHIVGGKPHRAPSTTRPPGATLTHPPVLPWQHARPQLPGLSGAGSGSSASGARSASSSSAFRVSPTSTHSAAPPPSYWNVGGGGGGVTKGRLGGVDSSMSAATVGGSNRRPMGNNANNEGSAAAGPSSFTYACKDYVQRHRVACIVDEWFFAVTSQKPFSPALFSYNYFRQRARMRHAVREEEEMGTLLTDEERERATALRHRRATLLAVMGTPPPPPADEALFTIPTLPVGGDGGCAAPPLPTLSSSNLRAAAAAAAVHSDDPVTKAKAKLMNQSQPALIPMAFTGTATTTAGGGGSGGAPKPPSAAPSAAAAITEGLLRTATPPPPTPPLLADPLSETSNGVSAGGGGALGGDDDLTNPIGGMGLGTAMGTAAQLPTLDDGAVSAITPSSTPALGGGGINRAESPFGDVSARSTPAIGSLGADDGVVAVSDGAAAADGAVTDITNLATAKPAGTADGIAADGGATITAANKKSLYNVLVLRNAVTGPASYSNKGVDKAIAAVKAALAAAPAHSAAAAVEVTVTDRNLVKDPVPFLNEESCKALRGGKLDTFGQRAADAFSTQLIGELKAADLIIIGLPRYNFGTPTSFKTYLDYVARPRVTFQYGPGGVPEGLLPPTTPVWCVMSAGGLYGDDYYADWLNTVLPFIGLKRLSFLRIEGVGMGKEKEAMAAFEEVLSAQVAAFAMETAGAP